MPMAINIEIFQLKNSAQNLSTACAATCVPLSFPASHDFVIICVRWSGWAATGKGQLAKFLIKSNGPDGDKHFVHPKRVCRWKCSSMAWVLPIELVWPLVQIVQMRNSRLEHTKNIVVCFPLSARHCFVLCVWVWQIMGGRNTKHNQKVGYDYTNANKNPIWLGQVGGRKRKRAHPHTKKQWEKFRVCVDCGPI